MLVYMYIYQCIIIYVCICVCVSLETDHLGVAKIISYETAFKIKQFETTVTASMIKL